MIARLVRLAVALVLAAGLSRAEALRERVSLNEGWRFRNGDPAGVDSLTLLYDARPEPRNEDEKHRLAESTADAEKVKAAAHRVLKPWILPTGNPFVKDPAKRHARPAGDPGAELACVGAAFDDGAWAPVRLPHDWAIAGPFNSGGVGGGMGRLPSPGIGWYRRKIDLPADDAGKSLFLDIDGAMSHASVWVNGKLAGGWPYGYASWRLDLTPHLTPGGENQIAIRLDNPPDFSRWYPGAGLYRNVWLVKTAPVHVGHWGTFVTTPEVSAENANVHLQTTVDNDSEHAVEVAVSTEIFPLDLDGERQGSAVARMDAVRLTISARDSAHTSGVATIKSPRLWGPPPGQQPHRYVAVTTVAQGGKVLDRYETRFGVRRIDNRPDGLHVNGERVRIQGVNQHHDLGALGAAFNERAALRQLELLRELGCNAIRMAHNPPAPELLELTDRLGFLVVNEIFDGWVRRKTPFDFHLIFPDWHEQDLRAFIRRDRNHPSVILWSIGNEVGEQYTGDEGAVVARRLAAMAREEDPTRASTFSMNWAKPDSAFAAAAEVIGLNYQGEGIRDTREYAEFKGIKTPPLYGAFRERFPDRMIFSSESAAAVSSRGVYLFPVAPGISNPVRDGLGGDSKIRQVSGYELHAADFGSSADKVFAAQDRHPFVAGEFVWSGWDYLGEPTPYYSSRSSYFGIIDLAGFPKDRFYLYQSRWRPDLPMAHILPHWTWPERVGQVTPVHVFTSGDEAELFLNGRSLGRKKKAAFEYRLRWDDTIYEPGILEVVAYKNDKQWARASVATAEDPAALTATSDRAAIRADGCDLAFVTVRITDARGRLAPRACDPLEFTLEGPGEIVATDNGAPTDMTAFPSLKRQAFNGLCLAIVRARPGAAGELRLTASGANLSPAFISISVLNP
jgi:beta-galactosidase